MKDKILALLKSQNAYLSGEEMSSQLGITRAGIWKNINKLKEEGYQIESITKRGYRLIATPDIITEAEIKSILHTNFLGRKIIYYDEVSSTNEMAKHIAREGIEEGALVIADRQLTGKGRLGKAWESPSGTGIWMSLVLRPQITPQKASQLTLLAGLNMCEAIQSLTGLQVQIKWPNDVVLNGKKICGILTEMSAELDAINYIILGIGVNVNTTSFPQEVPYATSLRQESGEIYIRRYIVKSFLEHFEQDYMNYKKEGDIHCFLDRYKKNCITLYRDIKVINHEKSYIAYAKDIAEDGSLVIINEEKQEKKILSGEVSVRGLYGYI